MHLVLQAVRDFIRQKQLFDSNDKLLIAISGGMDSVVLTDVIRSLGYHFGLAHVNFQLRGEESNGDADFVQSLAKKLGAAFHCLTFDTKSYCQQTGLSVQMAAREARYEWLEKVCEQNAYTHILTAHHLDDNVETFLLNFLRGTGAVGLAGIPPIRGKITRPLLNVTKQDLTAYAKEKQLSWREDSSNSKDDYKRNYLRHSVIPHLQQLQPAWSEVMRNNFTHLRQGKQLQQEALRTYWAQALDSAGHIQRQNLPSDPNLALSVLITGLSDYGFTPEQCRQLLVAKTGSLIHSKGVKAYHAVPTAEEIRLYLTTSTRPTDQASTILIPHLPIQVLLQADKCLKLSVIATPKNLQGNEQTVYLRKDLAFPLQIRYWQAGDSFQPFGMAGQHKKVQDYLTDLKIDAYQKQQIQVCIDANGAVLWVIGLRIAESVRVSPADSECIEAKLIPAHADTLAGFST